MQANSMRWSVNLNGLNTANWERWLAWGREVRPSYILVMDDKNKARQWQNEIGPVIYRAFHGYDSKYHLKVSAKQAAEDLARENQNEKDMWQYFKLNEGGGNWHFLQDWLLEFAELSKERGFKVTTCGLALSKLWPTPDFVKAGSMPAHLPYAQEHLGAGNADPLLQYAHDNPDTFLLDVHGYVTGPLWAPQIADYPQVLFDRRRLLAGEHIPVETHDYVGYQERTNWGMFRENWVFNARAIELFGVPLDYVITEYGNDWNDDIVRGKHTFARLPDGREVKTETELRARFTDPRYDILRGVLAHRKMYAWLLTGTADAFAISDDLFTEFVVRGYEWAERNTPPNCKGIMVYTDNRGWRLPQGHDIGDPSMLPTLLPKMKRLQKESTMINPSHSISADDSRWRPVALVVDGVVNVRAYPTTQNNANRLGVLSPDQTYYGIGLDTGIETFHGDNWNWYPYRLDDFPLEHLTELPTVWIAAVPQLTTDWDAKPPTEPSPPIEPPPTDLTLSNKVKAFAVAIILALTVLLGYFNLDLDEVFREIRATPTQEILR